jgi:hypothetical protein
MLHRYALSLAPLLIVAALAGAPALAGPAHHRAMDARGDKAMGFSHAATTHHFLLRPDGGVIQVTANDAADTSSESRIRAHLSHITASFAAGDFDLPMFVHDKVPPGVPEMQQLKKQITYRFEPIESGGRVTIRTRNARALVAIHDFLRFQIQEHETGDPLEVLEPQPR